MSAAQIPTVVQKCQCGHPSCKQYTLSSQGSVGFTLEDATLYAASHDMLAALESARVMLRKAAYHARNSLLRSDFNQQADQIDALIAKARGTSS